MPHVERAKAPTFVAVPISLAHAAQAGDPAEALRLCGKFFRGTPVEPDMWNALGMKLAARYETAAARRAFQRACERRPSADLFARIAATFAFEGDYGAAMQSARRGLALNPAHHGAWHSVAEAALVTGDWRTRWSAMRSMFKSGAIVDERTFGGVPRWDGLPVDCLAVYGVEGLGDEITYASMVSEAAERSRRLVLECDARLRGLFSRSFPKVEVQGTRREAHPSWAVGRRIDARCPAIGLGEFFRPTPSSCPRAPYLVADEARRLQWRELFASWRKPVVGLAWSGGVGPDGRAKNLASQRHVGLEALRGLIQSTGAAFVSLEYKDVGAEIAATALPVHQFERAVLSSDYDDTAALVAELDYVIGPPTTVHHLAGALGKASTILVPHRCPANVAQGDRLPWTAEQVYHRQRPGESWADCIARLPPLEIQRAKHSKP